MKHRRRRRIESGSSSSDTSQTMALSLFIMLLAFFIVLNSMSSFEEDKTAKVQQSLDVAFSKVMREENFKPSEVSDPVQSIHNGDSLQRVEGLFRAQIASDKATISTSRGTMTVKVPYEEFTKALFALDQVDLTQTQDRAAVRKNFLLPTLVSLLKTGQGDVPVRMEIYRQVSTNPARLQNEKPKEMEEIIQDVNRFSDLLEKQGLPQKLMNIGIIQGDPAFIKLVFSNYVSFSPVTRDTVLPKVVTDE